MPEVTLTQADSGKDVEIQKGTVVVIQLAENPTTGYQWILSETDGQLLVLPSSEFLLPPTPASLDTTQFGEGGIHVFKFTAKTVGTTQIDLKELRSWEQESPAAGTFSVTVTITE